MEITIKHTIEEAKKLLKLKILFRKKTKWDALDLELEPPMVADLAKIFTHASNLFFPRKQPPSFLTIKELAQTHLEERFRDGEEGLWAALPQIVQAFAPNTIGDVLYCIDEFTIQLPLNPHKTKFSLIEAARAALREDL